MTNTLSNIIPTRGSRKHFNVDVDEDGVLAREANDNRATLVMFNNGPDMAWANTSLETANENEGFPFPYGGVIVDSDSIDAWYFSTTTGNTADIRGWEVDQL